MARLISSVPLEGGELADGNVVIVTDESADPLGGHHNVSGLRVS